MKDKSYSKYYKPKMKFQNGKWHVFFPTKEDWSWYIGNGNTIEEAWDKFKSCVILHNAMNLNSWDKRPRAKANCQHCNPHTTEPVIKEIVYSNYWNESKKKLEHGPAIKLKWS